MTRGPNVRRNTAKVRSWIPICWIKHDEVPSEVPFQWTKGGKVPDDFLPAGAPPCTRGALFTIFTPASQISSSPPLIKDI